MTETSATSYDEIPYGSKAFAHTHPGFLATVATLFGLESPPIADCRVLELGCAEGGNLIPMAYELPGAEFLGVELSARQVEEGREVIRRLGLTNIRIEQADLRAVDEGFGRFDYIVAHGVYSWVPPAVQDHILTVCARNLAPNGVAYVSYNTYPGWHLRGMIREMIGYHVLQFEDRRTQVREARALVEFLARSTAGQQDGPYARLLQQEAEVLGRLGDSYLAHEHLEEVNQPLYYHEFVARARARGLQVLREAIATERGLMLPPAAQAALEQMAADPVRQDQYLDFLACRTFRRTLLCHESVRLAAAPSSATMRGLQVVGLARPVGEPPDVGSDATAQFRTIEGTNLSSNTPPIKAVLMALAEATPRAIPFEDLRRLVEDHYTRSSGRAPLSSEQVEASLADVLRRFHLTQVVELHRDPPAPVAGAGERPEASPLARIQAETRAIVTNLRHHNVKLSEFERALIRLLDGTRDRAALIDALEAQAVAASRQARLEGGAVDPAEVRRHLEESIDHYLRQMERFALLVG